MQPQQLVLALGVPAMLWLAACEIAPTPIAASEDAALIGAVRQCDLRAVRRLLRSGANANADIGDGRTVLMMASERGSDNMVRLLIDSGANVNGRSFAETPLLAAIRSRRPRVVELLLRRGALARKAGDDLEEPIVEAARVGSPECVSLLLSRGADPNARDSVGIPALHLVTDPRIAAALVAAGGRPQELGARGESVLHARARCGDTRMVLYWAHRDLPVEATDRNGQTALMCAAEGAGEGGWPETVRALLRLHAGPDVVRRDGKSALMLAAGAGDSDVMFPGMDRRIGGVCSLLLASGADPELADGDGLEAIHYAVAKHRWDAVAVIARSLKGIRARRAAAVTRHL